MTINPNTTGSQLLPLLTGKYARIGSYWVWQEDDTIHISDTIGGYGSRIHMAGGLEDKLCDFRSANGQSSGRQELLDAGWEVKIEDNGVLVVSRGGEVVYSHPTDGDRREYYRYRVRGWKVARRLHRGKGIEDVEKWWVKETRIEVAPEPDWFGMSIDELRRYR